MTIAKRIIADVLLALLVFAFPIGAIAFGFAATFFFDFYLELLAAGICIDLLFGSPLHNWYNFSCAYAALAALLLLASSLGKRWMVFYPKKFF